MVGGTDFGFNYNGRTNCFNAPNLPDNIEAAGKTWAGYEQGMPFPGDEMSTSDYSPDALPFFAFSDIFNDPARAQAHLSPLTQMAPYVASSPTTPHVARIAAADATHPP